MYHIAPLFGTLTLLVAQSEVPSFLDLGPFERLVSYVGLLAMGWFFWRRETGRADKTLEELKKENAILKEDIKKLERDIRSLLQNRSPGTTPPYKNREAIEHDFGEVDEDG